MPGMDVPLLTAGVCSDRLGRRRPFQAETRLTHWKILAYCRYMFRIVSGHVDRRLQYRFAGLKTFRHLLSNILNSQPLILVALQAN